MEQSPTSPARRALANAIRSGVVGLGRAAADAFAILAGFSCSYRGYAGVIDAGWLARAQPTVPPYVTIVALFTLLVVSVFVRMGLYRRRASILNLWELQTVVKGIAFASALLFSMLFFLKLTNYSRLVVVGGIGATTAFALLERRMMAALLGALYQRPQWTHRVLICGFGSTGRLLMKKIVQAPQLGWTVAGFLDDWARLGSTVSCRVAQGGPFIFQASVLGRLRQLAEVVNRFGINEVLVTVPNAPEKLRELFQIARNGRLRIGVVPHMEDARADQLEIEDVSAIPVLRSSAPSRKFMSAVMKRLFDLVVAPMLILATAPFWLFAIVAIRLDSPGSVFFVQNRVGLNGRRFRMLKFRTMWSDASAYDASPRGDDVDPRITRSGRFLRKTGIDELPQLLNVIRGDMSMVGPRPEMPFVVDRYGPLEKQRLLVKPGITGVWQLGADRHAEIHENLEYDLYYINYQSLLLDCVILLETGFFTVTQAARALRSRRTVPAATPEVSAHREAESYLLIAIDQRRRGSTPDNWHRWLVHLRSAAPRWAIKILVASHNAAYFNTLVEDARGSLVEFADRIDFVMFESRSETYACVAGASLVLTDLHTVAEWAEKAGVGVIGLFDGVSPPPPDTHASEKVAELEPVVDDSSASPAADRAGRAGRAAAAVAGVHLS